MEIAFQKALKGWVERAEKITGKNKLEIEEGRKYIKVIRVNDALHRTSTYCFINKVNGDVLMAASWSAPAKHARGSIYTPGKEGVDEYGALYLK